MAERILWDEYEAAILLDALIQVLNGTISRSDAVSAVSAELRRRARRKGLKIDDVFRNENGISWQMIRWNMLSQMENQVSIKKV